MPTNILAEPDHKTLRAPPSQGLYRTTLAGSGRSLLDAFASIERSSQVEQVLRLPKRDSLSARIRLRPQEGQGYWELTQIREDLYIIQSNFAYKEPRLEFVPGDGLVQFNFMLSGDLTYGIDQPGLLRFNRPSMHLWRQPRGVDMHEWTAPGAHAQSVTISLHPEFLREHFLMAGGEVPQRLHTFMSEDRRGADFYQAPLTAQMFELTTKLLKAPYAGASYLMYKEALTLELLCVTVESLLSMSDARVQQYSERELRALSAAKELLMERFAPPPTLREIARSVGLAERVLTRAFKAVYGETLFDFSLRCRMERALTLLREHQWSVDRVSEAAGYAHPTSFATAFRRHFGLRPIDMKLLKTRPLQSKLSIGTGRNS